MPDSGRLRGALADLAPPPSIDDQALAADAASGSRAAFEALVQRYGGRVLAMLERRLDDHDRAHDLCQETWIRVHRAFRRDAQSAVRGSFRSWLFAIALNLARDEGRSRQRAQRREQQDESMEQRESRDRPGEALEQRDAVDAALAAVDEPFRTALVLVDVEGLDYAEAARSADCATGTMKSRVARGRARFRDAWRQLTDHPERTGT